MPAGLAVMAVSAATGWATAGAARATGAAATALAGSGVSGVRVRAWNVLLQNLQRIAWPIHSDGMRKVCKQCGHLAWTT